MKLKKSVRDVDALVGNVEDMKVQMEEVRRDIENMGLAAMNLIRTVEQLLVELPPTTSKAANGRRSTSGSRKISSIAPPPPKLPEKPKPEVLDEIINLWNDPAHSLTTKDILNKLTEFNTSNILNDLTEILAKRTRAASIYAETAIKIEEMNRLIQSIKEAQAAAATNTFPMKPQEEDPGLSEDEMLELAKATAGIFQNVKKFTAIRMKNTNQWLAQRNFLKNVGKPGVLEIDANSILDCRPGALEPQRRLPPLPINSMHPFSNEEMKILSNIRSRVNYLGNPRFTRIPLERTRLLHDSKVPWNSRGKSQNHPTASVPVAAATEKQSCSKHLRPTGGGIAATPETILFSDYIPNQKYSQFLKVTNRTHHSARFRLCFPPPYTFSSYFSVTTMSTPLNYDGLVAPGMSCRYKITFKPDSLANFESTLIVHTELVSPLADSLPLKTLTPSATTAGGSTALEADAGYISFSVPLLARRDPPELTIPDVLHCGPCRAGFISVRKWSFTNIGGPGRFLILPRGATQEKWDIYGIFEMMRKKESGLITEEVEMPPPVMKFGPFEVSPSYFSVESGGTGEIQICLSASNLDGVEKANNSSCIEVIEEALAQIACDNQQVLQLPLRSIVQKPSVTIINCLAVDPETHERSPVNLEGNLVKFGNQNIQATTKYILTLENNSRLRLPFNWSVIDNPGRKNISSIKTFSRNLSFSVKPSSGYLAPNARLSFELCFCPLEVKEYEVITMLLLKNEDISLHPITNPDSEESMECIFKLFCSGKGLNYDLAVQPALILLPGGIHAGHSWRTEIDLINHSVSRASYSWSLQDIDPCIVDITVVRADDDGVFDEGDELAASRAIVGSTPERLVVTISGRFPGQINGFILFNTAEGVGPMLKVPVMGNVIFKPGFLEFEPTYLDFNLLRLGESNTVQIPLKSNAMYPVKVKISDHLSISYADPEESVEDDQKPWVMRIQPNEFFINPEEVVTIDLTYIPLWYQRMRGVLACEVISENEQNTALAAAVEMRAEVRTPFAKIEYPTNHVSCFVGVPFVWTVVIQNLTGLRTDFAWWSEKADKWNVEFSPKSGTLESKQTLMVDLTITFLERGVFQNVEFGCYIDGMVEMNGLLFTTLTASVYGLRSFLKVEDGSRKLIHLDADVDTPEQPPTEPSPLKFDFGQECPLFSSKSLSLKIRNASPVTSNFRVWVETYTGEGIDEDEANIAAHRREEEEEDDEEEEERVAMLDSERSKGGPKNKMLLKKTKRDKIGFSSAPGRAYMESIKEVRRRIRKMHRLLREGRGAAFHASPSHGMLKPWEEVIITLTGYNNLVGQYDDNFVIEMGGWVRETIPVSLPVEGVPVKLSGAQLVKSNRSLPIDKLNFGTRIIQLGSRQQASVFPVSCIETLDDINKYSKGCLAEVITKVVQIENQSPRTISVHWRVFVRKDNGNTNPATPIWSKLNPKDALMEELKSIMTPGNLRSNDLNDSPVTVRAVPSPDNISIAVASPAMSEFANDIMLIPAMKTLSFAVSFCPSEVGFMSAVLAGDVGYLQSDGNITMNPAGTQTELSEAKKFSRQIRLMVQGKAIKPLMVGEQGTEPSLRFREITSEAVPVVVDRMLTLAAATTTAAVGRPNYAAKTTLMPPNSAPTTIQSTPIEVGFMSAPVTPTGHRLPQGSHLNHNMPAVSISASASPNGNRLTINRNPRGSGSNSAVADEQRKTGVGSNGVSGVDKVQSIALRNSVDASVQFKIIARPKIAFRITDITKSNSIKVASASASAAVHRKRSNIALDHVIDLETSLKTSDGYRDAHALENTVFELLPAEIITVQVEKLDKPPPPPKSDDDDDYYDGDDSIKADEPAETDYKNGHIMILFENGTVQTIPISVITE